MLDLLAMSSFAGFVGGVLTYHFVVLKWLGRAQALVEKSQRRGHPAVNDPHRWR